MKTVSSTLSALIQLSLDSHGEPPTEIRLFAMGENKTKKGSFYLDAAGGAQALEAFAASGLDALPFDAGHGMLAGAMAHPESHKALGWFVPEMRLDGLWASSIDWTPATHAALTAKEYRFFSPAISFEEKTRRIVGLTNVALTNLPATLGQKPLVLSDDTEAEEKMTVLFEKLGAADETEALSALSGLLALRDGLVSLGCADLSAVQALVTERDSLKLAAETAIAEKLASEKSALLSAVPPANRAFAESLSLEQLTAYVPTLPKLSVKVEEPKRETATVELSAEDLAVCERLNISHEDFLAAKKAEGNK